MKISSVLSLTVLSLLCCRAYATPYSPYYDTPSERDDSGYYTEEQEEGILESTVGAFERTINDMGAYLWASIEEGLNSLRGFIEQPQAASRQAFDSFSNLIPDIQLPGLPSLPSFAEVAERPIVAMDVAIDGRPAGRILFELFHKTVPRTVENFRILCSGPRFQYPLGQSYVGTKFHRIIPGFMIQGGDFENGDGTGGYSIYGGQFEDEGFTVPHNSSGLLSMANAGPNTNGAQFFITVNKTPWLDGKHVVFGRVYDLNSYDVVKTIEAYGSKDGTPSSEITITDCQQLR